MWQVLQTDRSAGGGAGKAKQLEQAQTIDVKAEPLAGEFPKKGE